LDGLPAIASFESLIAAIESQATFLLFRAMALEAPTDKDWPNLFTEIDRSNWLFAQANRRGREQRKSATYPGRSLMKQQHGSRILVTCSFE
jgi:hypothetical protein